MSQRSNIFWFKGDNKVFLKKELDRWIEDFKMKHGDFNISRIHGDLLNKINLETELTTPPFLASYRLIILEDIFSDSSNEDNSEVQDNGKLNIDKFYQILENTPENNIIILWDTNIEKKINWTKKIELISKIKTFNNPNVSELKLYIRERLINIDNDAIDELIRYKNNNLEKIELELDKLELFCIGKRVSLSHIRGNVIPELEVSIFSFIDNFYVNDTKNAIKNLEILLETSNIFAIFAGLMSNLRNFLYVCLLFKLGYKKEQILETLKLKAFVVTKSLGNINNYNKILTIYYKLVELDRSSKTGEIIGDAEDGMKLGLQKIIFNLKNIKN